MSLGHRNHDARDDDENGEHGDGRQSRKLLLYPLGREEHSPDLQKSIRQSCKDSDRDHQGNTITNTSFGNLLTQPHQQKRSSGQNQDCLQSISPDIIRTEEDQVPGKAREERFGFLPTKRHKETLSETKQNCQVATYLNDLAAPSFFTSHFTQTGQYSGQQLDDDGCADVWHDAQRANPTSLKSSSREEAVHTQKAVIVLGR